MEDGLSSFWGPVTSTDWCEKNYVHSSYVAEFFNTLSNVPCILLALFGLVNAVSQHFEKRFSVLHLSNMALAIGSMLYHATLQRVQQQGDETPMVWEMLLYIYILHSPDWHYRSTMPTFLFLYGAGFAILHLLVRFGTGFKVHYAILCLLCIPRMYKYYIFTEDKSAKCLAKLYVVTIFLASACWLFDKLLCRKVDQWYINPQGHALWHVLMGFNSYFANTFLMFCRAKQLGRNPKSSVEKLWETADSGGWRPSSAPRSEWRSPPSESNGYLRVRCNGGLNQQRSAICNAVLAARIMNAVLVLPELDANSFWHDDSGFRGIYDVEHFIKTLRYDVKIVEKLPDDHKNGKGKKIKAYQLRPPRDASISCYLTTALEKMKEHGAIYLTPFSHRLAEEIDNPEYQRLRCRVNYHALRFKPLIMKLSKGITDKLRSQGHFMSIHLRFEMDMLAFAGCFDIFTPEEQKILKKYREENFAKKWLVPSERRAIGKCPLTPGEVALLLRAMGFDNSTRIYLAAGEIIGERYMKPFRDLFPHLENHSSVDPSEEFVENTSGLIGSAVDYMVCLLSDIFMPTYDGPSNFANNLLGHRLYYGFRTTIRPDRKSLAPFFLDQETGQEAGFQDAVKRVMSKTNFGGPHTRVSPESFYTNSWPECFCQSSSTDPAHKCPPENVMEILDKQLGKEADNDLKSSVQQR